MFKFGSHQFLIGKAYVTPQAQSFSGWLISMSSFKMGHWTGLLFWSLCWSGRCYY